jgi:hypothetical protein
MINKTYFTIIFSMFSLNLCRLECNEQQNNSQPSDKKSITIKKELIDLNTFGSEKNNLIRIAQDYLKFINDVGSAESVKSDDVRIKTLFAENLTKIDNRTILFENDRELLLPQMRGFEKEYNPESNKADWVVDIDNALIISSIETNAVVIHFEWLHVNVGRGTTTVILQCNNNNQIERITDVWAKVQK